MIPALVVIGLMYFWSTGAGTALYATARMLAQLLLIGYVLVYIFEAEHPGIIIAVIFVMIVVSSWIAIRQVENDRGRAYLHALAAVAIAGIPVLALVSQSVIGIEPWFSPRYVVPLAGMIFSGAMTAVGLAAERYQSEISRGEDNVSARKAAFNAAMIPMVNSLFAVGLVSLPGMMTGQILSGVSPLVAAKYQIVVMSMLLGVSGISTAIYLVLQGKRDEPVT